MDPGLGKRHPPPLQIKSLSLYRGSSGTVKVSHEQKGAGNRPLYLKPGDRGRHPGAPWRTSHREPTGQKLRSYTPYPRAHLNPLNAGGWLRGGGEPRLNNRLNRPGLVPAPAHQTRGQISHTH